MQFSLHTLVAATPGTVRWLRTQIHSKPQFVPEDKETRNANGPKSKPPLNLDAVDAADLELEALGYWCEQAGISTRGIGRTWRVSGHIRGVLYGDTRPARVLATRLLAAMEEPGWTPPVGMHEHLHGLRAAHAHRWPELVDLIYETLGVAV